MSFHLQRTHWMPSPPLVPDEAPLDLTHLDRVTLGDAELEREVLALFAAQSAVLIPRLLLLSDDASAIAHTLKGSAKAIGAHRVSDAAEAFEAMPDDIETLRDLQNAVEAAIAAIALRLQRC